MISSDGDHAALRVLFISYNFPPKLGGLEQVVLEVWTALTARAETVALAQFGGEYQDAESDVYRPGRGGLLAYFWFVWRTGRALSTERPFDLVIAGSALTAIFAWLLTRRTEARSAVILYGLDTIYPSLVYQATFRFAVPKLDKVIAISSATRAEALARGVSAGRIEVVHPGCYGRRFMETCDTEDFREAWGLKGAKVILSAGRLVKRKGLDRFVLECLPQVVEAVPEAKLLCAGGNPEEAAVHRDDMVGAVVKAAEDAGMTDHIVITGRLSADEMVSAFQSADLFVLPAVPMKGEMEGFGIVFLEAAAAGLPSVSTRVWGIPDAVVDGETGVLVDALDYDAMARTLIELLADPERRRALGDRGRERVEESFLWEHVAGIYSDVLLRAASS